jgi:hypothetical protein
MRMTMKPTLEDVREEQCQEQAEHVAEQDCRYENLIQTEPLRAARQVCGEKLPQVVEELRDPAAVADQWLEQSRPRLPKSPTLALKKSDLAKHMECLRGIGVQQDLGIHPAFKDRLRSATTTSATSGSATPSQILRNRQEALESLNGIYREFVTSPPPGEMGITEGRLPMALRRGSLSDERSAESVSAEETKEVSGSSEELDERSVSSQGSERPLLIRKDSERQTGSNSNEESGKTIGTDAGAEAPAERNRWRSFVKTFRKFAQCVRHPRRSRKST